MEDKVYVVIGSESLEPNISVYDPTSQSIIPQDSMPKDLVIEPVKLNRICYICGDRELFRTNTFRTTTDSVRTLTNTKIFCEGGCPVVTEVCDLHTDDEEYSRFVATHVMITKSHRDERSNTTTQGRKLPFRAWCKTCAKENLWISDTFVNGEYTSSNVVCRGNGCPVDEEISRRYVEVANQDLVKLTGNPNPVYGSPPVRMITSTYKRRFKTAVGRANVNNLIFGNHADIHSNAEVINGSQDFEQILPSDEE